MNTINVGLTENLNLPLTRLGQDPSEYSLWLVSLESSKKPSKAEQRNFDECPAGFEEVDVYSYINDNWVLVAFNNADVHTFGVRGGIDRKKEGPYTHIHTVNKAARPTGASTPVGCKETVEEVIQIAPVLAKDMAKLTQLFFDTEAGPNQYFVGRLLEKCQKAGVVGIDDALIFRLDNQATYADYEYLRNDNGYFDFDKKFLDKWDDLK